MKAKVTIGDGDVIEVDAPASELNRLMWEGYRLEFGAGPELRFPTGLRLKVPQPFPMRIHGKKCIQ